MDINRKLKELLIGSGLADDEVTFYLALLKNPERSVYEVSRQVKIPKDRAYQICENLKEKHLLRQDMGARKSFKIAPLTGFIEKLNNQSRKLGRNAEKLNELKYFLPFLSGTEEDFAFDVFGHEEAGERFVDMTYLKWNQVFAYGDFESVLPAVTAEADHNFVRRRLKSGGKAFPVIANPQEYCWEYVIGKDDLEMRKTKVLYSEKLRNHFVIFAPEVNTTTIFTADKFGKVSGAVIKNPVVNQLHQGIYEYLGSVATYEKFRKNEEQK